MTVPLRDKRRRVAKEAAFLLYSREEREYKQAKIKAAEILGVKVYPSNREVADELDRLADEIEGSSRNSLLVDMRREALKIMEVLEKFNPIVVGSVWRGTVNRNSDIDILVFTDYPQRVKDLLVEAGYKIEYEEHSVTVKNGERESHFHLHLTLSSGREVDLSIKPSEERHRKVICEIYGDEVKGLDLSSLRSILKSDPLRRFVPQ